MIELLRRLHRRAAAAMGTRAARIAATLAVVAAAVAFGWPILATSASLQSQRSAILAVLSKCSAKDRDPAALQLLQRGTVTVGDRDYGGPRVVSRPMELFDADGTVPADVRDELAWRLLWDQVPAWMPYALVRSPSAVVAVVGGAAAALVAAAWAGLLLTVLEVGGLVVLACVGLWRLGWPAASQWLASASLAFLLFAFLWRGVRIALGWRSGPLAVASNTALEGVRTLAAPGFALPVAVLLPLLAIGRDRADPLLQAVPGFLDWGHTASYTFAALFVIFFGCATAAFDVRDRQVWSVLTKPVSPGGWLLGKWLGTLALGLSITAGGVILLGAGTAYLASQRPADERDARDLRSTVLVGRVGTRPQWQAIAPDRLREMVDREISADAVLRADIDNGKADEGEARMNIARQRAREFLEQQRRIGPGESREFVFPGLRPAVQAGRLVALRYKLHGGGEDEHERFPAMFQYASGPGAGMWELRQWIPGEAYTLRIDPRFVDDDGTLRLRVFSAGWDEERNQPRPSPITIFVQEDSLEVMVDDSTFAGNLVSALAVDGLKLAFLAALAVTAGALLSFPIAVLTTAGIFSMATLTPFLVTSLQFFEPDPKASFVAWAFQHVVKAISSTVAAVLGGFAAQSPSDMLAQGRSITLESVLATAASLGLVWTGGVLLLGWASVRRKEIAVYSGQG